MKFLLEKLTDLHYSIEAVSNKGTLFVCISEAINRKVELDWGTEDSEYLQKVELHSEGALNEIRPDIIIYNAGTDILDGDPLGGLSISPQVKCFNHELAFIYFLVHIRVAP